MSQNRKLYGKSRTIPVLTSTLQILSWLVRGNLRKQIFLSIQKRTTPSELVEKLAGERERKSQSHYTQVSRALAELEAQGLIVCLNPKEKTGRFYMLTNKGQTLRKELST